MGLQKEVLCSPSRMAKQISGKLPFRQGLSSFVEEIIFHLCKALEGIWMMKHHRPFGVREEHSARHLCYRGTRRAAEDATEAGGPLPPPRPWVRLREHQQGQPQ